VIVLLRLLHIIYAEGKFEEKQFVRKLLQLCGGLSSIIMQKEFPKQAALSEAFECQFARASVRRHLHTKGSNPASYSPSSDNPNAKVETQMRTRL
jgi:hypothetical protein